MMTSLHRRCWVVQTFPGLSAPESPEWVMPITLITGANKGLGGRSPLARTVHSDFERSTDLPHSFVAQSTKSFDEDCD
jgi:hypothetical protein